MKTAYAIMRLNTSIAAIASITVRIDPTREMSVLDIDVAPL